VDPHNVDALGYRERNRREATFETVGSVGVQDLSDCRLARRTYQDRLLERSKVAETAKESQVIRGALSESKSWIDHNPIARNSGTDPDID
jgi:hypothetical protein